MNHEQEEKIKNALKDLPGAAIDASDDETVEASTVKERTHTLNNNPRNTDDAMPVNPD